MSVTPATIAPPSPRGGPRASSSSQSFFQKKTAGLPRWAWIAIVTAGVLGYVVYVKIKGASSGSTATTASSQAPASTTSSGTPGGGNQGGFGIGGTGANSSGSPTPTAASPSLPFQVQSGSGWWTGSPSTAQNTIITDASGNEYEWVDATESQSLGAAGITQYYEVLPGVFVPLPSDWATSLAGGTPIYVMVPSGTQANPAPTTASTTAPAATAQGTTTGSPAGEAAA